MPRILIAGICTIGLLCLIACSGGTPTAPLPARSTAAKPSNNASAEASLSSAGSGPGASTATTTEPSFRDRAEAAMKTMSPLEKEIAEKLCSGQSLLTLDPESMRQGDFGVMTVVEVQQVIDHDTLLATAGESMFILRGVSTNGMVDHRSYRISDEILFVEGTESYTTILGAKRTVFSVRAIDQAKIALVVAMDSLAKDEEREALTKQAEIRERERQEKLNPKPRVWASEDGKYVIEATFVSYANGKVRLRKVDGSEIDVTVERLGEDDRAWIKDRGQERSRVAN